MAISAKQVQELRSRSGAALMDCKKALEATAGDVEAAFDHLRKAGLKTAEKKAGRSMAEGRVAFEGDGTRGAMVALTCETDFVARTEDFNGVLRGLARAALESGAETPEALAEQGYPGSDSVADALKQLTGKLGENTGIGQVARYENAAGRVGAYVHHDSKKGVIVSVTSKAAADATDAFVKDLGMHVAAIKPAHLSRDQVPEAEIERERAIHREGLQGKPADIQEKILQGKLDKFFAETCLLDQPWVKDDSQTVAAALAKALGPDARIEAFTRFQIGA